MVPCPPVQGAWGHPRVVFVPCPSGGRDGYPAPYSHVPPLCGASPSDSLCDRLTGRAKPMPKDVEGFITVQAGKPMTAHLVPHIPHPSEGDPRIFPAAFFVRTANPNRGMLSSHERRYPKHLCPWRVLWVSCYRPSKRTQSNICPL